MSWTNIHIIKATVWKKHIEIPKIEIKSLERKFDKAQNNFKKAISKRRKTNNKKKYSVKDRFLQKKYLNELIYYNLRNILETVLHQLAMWNLSPKYR